MLVKFLFELRAGGIPVTITEFLTLLEALHARVAFASAQEFYHLARTCLVKDERHYDRFDRVFAQVFTGAEQAFNQLLATVPAEWLRALTARTFSEEEKRQVEALGGWEKLLETLRARLKEQQERHQGGNKWIGTGGTSPFGAYGYNPEGIRIGQGGSRQRRAVKVWDRREFRNLDDTVELGTRHLKLALRKLRRFAREGAADQLDLDGTIAATARNAGMLDLRLVPERRNAVKVLLFLDVGGSMDDHIRICEELFSAARSEFKHLEYFYFHNFLYERVWRDNRR
ncbi:MAG: VWA domain-containing protein, partial [Sinobacteraceae bacterium]|nr:VWA domain-containing protein [Nevskiaceae bacterium]